MVHDQAVVPPRVHAPAVTIGKVLLLAFAFDIAANGQTPGLSVPVFFIATALVFNRELLRSIEDRALIGAGIVVSAFTAIRGAPLLIGLDVLVALALFALAAIPDSGTLMRASLMSYVRRGWALGTAALRAPAYFLGPILRMDAAGRLSRTRPIIRTVSIAVPVLTVFAILLASADRVFGDLVTPGLPHWHIGSIVGHLFFIAFGIGAAATLARAAAGPGVSDTAASPRAPKLGVAEWVTVLAGVDVLFALFVGVQFAVLFGGKHRVSVTPGLTYAQYARSGFFQLIVVAGLTVLVILGVWDLGARRSRRQFRVFTILVSTMVGLSGVILISAWKRLFLYDAAFGFTSNRFAAMIAIAWTAFVLIAVLVCLLSGARDRVVAVVLVGTLATLAAVNVTNPDRFIARQNVARFDRAGSIDATYLASALGPDAVPVVLDVLPRLDHSDASMVREMLCARLENLQGPSDVRSWNVGRRGARAALTAAGLNESSCVKKKY